MSSTKYKKMNYYIASTYVRTTVIHNCHDGKFAVNNNKTLKFAEIEIKFYLKVLK